MVGGIMKLHLKIEYQNYSYYCCHKCMKKYKKYYNFMNEVDIYYLALILDPRFKSDLISKELEADENSGILIINTIYEKLHLKY
jgi:hypothetical protein